MGSAEPRVMRSFVTPSRDALKYLEIFPVKNAQNCSNYYLFFGTEDLTVTYVHIGYM